MAKDRISNRSLRDRACWAVSSRAAAAATLANCAGSMSGSVKAKEEPVAVADAGGRDSRFVEARGLALAFLVGLVTPSRRLLYPAMHAQRSKREGGQAVQEGEGSSRGGGGGGTMAGVGGVWGVVTATS